MTEQQPAAMTADRAIEINRVLVEAWMIREGLKAGAIPDLSSISQSEAVEASEMMEQRRLGERENPDGSTTITCHVAPSRVPRLYDWARSALLDRWPRRGNP